MDCCNDNPRLCLCVLRGQGASCNSPTGACAWGCPVPAHRQQGKCLGSCWPGRPQRVKLKTPFKVSLFLSAGLKVLHFRRTSAIWAVAQSELKSCIPTTRARLFRSEQTLTSVSSVDQARIMTHKPKAFVDSSKTEKSYHSSVTTFYRDSHDPQKVQKQSLGERKGCIWLSPLWPNGRNQDIVFA